MRLIFIFCLLISAGIAIAQTPKYAETMIPVRDGESLAADIYIRDSTIKKPTILIQTPYNKNLFRILVYLPEGGGIALPYDSLKYNYVIVDWRGFFASKNAGTGKPTYDRGLDGYDIVEWIAAQSWSDGKVGMWGGSALGAIQFLTMKHRPPHLVCAMPFIMDYKTEYSDFFPGGVYMREHYDKVESLGLVSTSFILQHPTLDNTWKVAALITDYPDSINVPLLMATGWFDHFPDGVIRAYEDLRARSDVSVRDKHKLVIGPWLHTKFGTAEQGILSYPEAAGVPTNLAFQFFGFYLLGEETAWEASPAVRYFDLGDHTWYTAGLWSEVRSATETLRLYMTADERLDKELSSSAGSVVYKYDPRDPSPSIGSSTFNDTLLHGPQDISNSVEVRDDIAIFSTDVLTEDIIVRGTIKVKLTVKASIQPDTDFGARLCDVFPDGRSIIITDAIRRLRFRNGYETEELATPGLVYPIEVELRNLAMTFQKGHRLRIDITSSNFPRFDLNPNSGGKLYQPSDTFITHNTIFVGGTVPTSSYVEIPIVPSLGMDRLQVSTEEIIVSPNPCGEKTNLLLDSKIDASVNYELFDLMGRRVTIGSLELQKGSNTVEISLAGLPGGTYYLHIPGNKSGFARVIKGF